MKVVVAMDSFKESMTSLQAGFAAREGILRAAPNAEVSVFPLADGGEGTLDALISGMRGRRCVVPVEGPLGEEVLCSYGIAEIGGQKTAVLEIAGAVGLMLVPPEKRNLAKASTYGVGQVIRAAIREGCRRFLIGLGGSATNDGGAGMLQALGYELLDEEENPISRGVEGLKKLCRIDNRNVMPELSSCTFRVACDVNNPLCGSKGASAVFGLQKGASGTDIPQMDACLHHFAVKCAEIFPLANEELPGSGAAGGLGFAFRTCLNAELESGVQLILEEIRLREELADADVLVTGEGRLDAQTVMGKAPIGAAKLAKKCGCLTVALSGAVTKEAGACNAEGIDAFFPIVRGASSLEEAMKTQNAMQNMTDAAEQAMRLICAVWQQKEKPKGLKETVEGRIQQ